MREKFERSLMSSNRACSSRKRREFHENGANPCRRKPPRQISGAAIEHLQRDETFRQKLAALDNPVLYVRERGLGLFIQRLPAQCFGSLSVRCRNAVA
jgi:hypothetical protein